MTRYEYRSAVSGLWYQDPQAAGDIDAMREAGKPVTMWQIAPQYDAEEEADALRGELAATEVYLQELRQAYTDLVVRVAAVAATHCGDYPDIEAATALVAMDAIEKTLKGQAAACEDLRAEVARVARSIMVEVERVKQELSKMWTEASVQHQVAMRLAGQLRGDSYPECSGDESSCPENEGYGCCGKTATNNESEVV